MPDCRAKIISTTPIAPATVSVWLGTQPQGSHVPATSTEFHWPFPKVILFFAGGFLAAIATVLATTDGDAMQLELGEMGAIEQVQRLALAVVFFLSLVSLCRPRASSFVFGHMFLACMSLSILFRETAFCDSPYQVTLSCAGHVTQPAVTILAMVIFLVFLIWWLWKKLAQTLILIHPRMTWPIGLVFTFAAVGQAMETGHWQIAEELFELSAYLLLVVIGVLSTFFMRREHLP